MPQPSGIVTFLFTDVEGSTLLWEAHGEAMQVALAEHDRLIQAAADDADGYVFSTAGDAFAMAFHDPGAAIGAALASQLVLQARKFDQVGRIKVRMAIHTGTAEERDGNYFGSTLNRCARILSIASGDEALISSATFEHLNGGMPDEAGLADIGEFRLKDLGRSNRVYRLTHPDLTETSAALDPQRIRGYEVIEKIGEGGFGVVYRARQSGIEREVAVKAVRPEFANNAQFIRRFDAEAQLVARLEHPFIVPLYDYWREPSGAFLVMRWLKGGSLESSLRSGPWSLAASLELLRQVGDALATAHRNDIVHRDLKPANILIDGDGNAYLSDFGIAADVAASIQLDALDQSTDWPAYASPELLRREKATPESDIYSLGLVLYELLTGEYPFGQAVPSELIERQLHHDLTSVDEMRPEIPAALARVIRRATSRDPEKRYRDVGQLVREFEAAVSAEPSSVMAFGGIARNPYKGLAAFQQSDTGDFFGRKELSDQIISNLMARRIVAVVGPSGSGKSSVVKAGVLPALQSGGVTGCDDWFFTEMVPAIAPFEELETALLRVAVNPPATLLEQLQENVGGLARAVKRVLPAGDEELVLVIDQFEEVFSLVSDSEVRKHFLESLLYAAGDERNRLRVVITLRADFFDQPLLHPEFAEALKAGLVTVTPLSGEELEHAIVEPGRRVGVSFEPGLVGDIVTEVADQTGALPLLQYALTELFERRDQATLTKAEYHALGGVAGALGRRAEEVYAGLDDAGADAARQVFLRLVTLGEGTGDTRRRVSRDELAAMSTDAAAVDDVLDAFGGQRLIAFDRDPATRRPTAEVAHEALLREWSRLRDWIDTGRADVRSQRRLSAGASEWKEADRDPSFLLSGARLEQAETWMAASDIALTESEAAFIEASLGRRRSEEDAEQARLARERALERRSVSRLRVLVGVLGLAVVGAAGLSFFAFSQRSEAQAQARQARAQGLATAAIADLDSDPELSLLLALEGANMSREAGEAVIPEIIDALHRGLLETRTVFTLTDSSSGGFSPDGTEIVIGHGSEVEVRDAETGRVARTMRGHTGFVTRATFSPDGVLIATAGTDGSIRLWDAESGLFLRRLEGHTGGVESVVFSPDGSKLASWGADSAARVWDVSTGEAGPSFQSLNGVLGVAWSPDSDLLAISTGGVTVIDTNTGERVVNELADMEPPGTGGLAFSPDGRTLAVGRPDGSVELWDFERIARLEGPARSLTGHTDIVMDLAFDPTGFRLATAGDDGEVLIRDFETGDVIVTVPGHTAGVRSVEFSPSGRAVLTTSRDGVSRRFDISAAGSREWVTLEAAAPLSSLAISPDGSTVLAGSFESEERSFEWDVSDPEHGEPIALPDQIEAANLQDAFISRDWTRVFGITQDQTIVVWERETWVEVNRIRTRGFLDVLAVSHDGALVANVNSPEVEIYDVESGEIVRSWPLDLDVGVGAVGFSPDSTLLAAATSEGIKVWRVEDGTVLFEDVMPGDEAQDAAPRLGFRFNSDGSWIAVSAADASIRMWDIASGEPRGEVLTHSGDVVDMALSTDDEQLASASTDGTVRVWDLSDSVAVLTLSGHTGGVSGVAFHPSGDRLYTAGRDATVRVFALAVDDLISLAEARLTRGLSNAECRLYSLGDGCG